MRLDQLGYVLGSVQKEQLSDAFGPELAYAGGIAQLLSPLPLGRFLAKRCVCAVGAQRIG